MHPAAQYVPGQTKSFDGFPEEIKCMIIDLTIAGEDLKVEPNGPNGSCNNRTRADVYWSPSWVPGLRLVSKSFSNLATISITRAIVPLISINSYEYQQNDPVQTMQSFNIGPLFPPLATNESKILRARDQSAAFVLLPHIEIDVGAFPKLQQLILGPIDIAEVANWQLLFTKNRTVNWGLDNLLSLYLRMLRAERRDAELVSIMLLQIIPNFAINGFTPDACEKAVKRLMRLWHDRARRSPMAYGLVMRQVAKMVGAGRQCIRSLPESAELVLQFYDCRNAITTGTITYLADNSESFVSVMPNAAAEHVACGNWVDVLL